MFFPPASAVDGMKPVPSVCLSVCYLALSQVNPLMYGPKIVMIDMNLMSRYNVPPQRHMVSYGHMM